MTAIITFMKYNIADKFQYSLVMEAVYPRGAFENARVRHHVSALTYLRGKGNIHYEFTFHAFTLCAS